MVSSAKASPSDADADIDTKKSGSSGIVPQSRTIPSSVSTDSNVVSASAKGSDSHCIRRMCVGCQGRQSRESDADPSVEALNLYTWAV